MSSLILTTTYTDNSVLAHIPKGSKGSGLYVWKLDSDTGSLKLLQEKEVGPNPAFLVQHGSNPNVIYASTECIHKNGEILTLHMNEDGKVELTQRTDAGGRSTCHLEADKSQKTMTCINYWEAIIATFPMKENGDLDEKNDAIMMPGAEYVMEKKPDRMEHWQFRQRWPHTHCAVTEPYQKEQVFVADLGRDKLLSYIHREGKLLQTAEIQLDNKTGPRGIVFHPTLSMIYVTNELTSTISACKFNRDVAKGLRTTNDGEVRYFNVSDEQSLVHQMQRISTLPLEEQDKYFTNELGVWKAASHSSEIRMHPTGKFLYIGNRGHESITVYQIDQESGLLTEAEIKPSGGKTPRNFNFDISGKFLIVGNQDSNNITVFKIDQETGILDQVHQVSCPSVNYVYPIALPAVN